MKKKTTYQTDSFIKVINDDKTLSFSIFSIIPSRSGNQIDEYCRRLMICRVTKIRNHWSGMIPIEHV
jgi:hypothetical protein